MANFQQLKDAQERFAESAASLAGIPADGAGREVMVPLTASLYVPGTLAGLEEVLVDIGTGFYVGALRADAHGPRRARVCVRGVRASSRELLPRLTPPPHASPAARTGKPAEAAVDMLNRKAAKVKANTESLMKYVSQKQHNLAVVSASLEDRLAAQQQQQRQAPNAPAR